MSRLFSAILWRKCNWETNWSKWIKSFSNFPRKTRELLLRITLFPRGCCYCIYHRSAVSVSDIVLPWIGDAPSSKESKSQWFSPNCLLSLLPPIELYTLHHSEFDTRSRKVPTLEHPSRPTLLPAIIAYYCLLLHSYHCPPICRMRSYYCPLIRMTNKLGHICEEWGWRWGQCSLSLMQHPLQKLMKHKCQT